jgi:hypothetical protein
VYEILLLMGQLPASNEDDVMFTYKATGLHSAPLGDFLKMPAIDLPAREGVKESEEGKDLEYNLIDQWQLVGRAQVQV